MADGFKIAVEGDKATARRLLGAQVKARVELKAALGEVAKAAAQVGEEAADVGGTGNLSSNVSERVTRAGNWIVGSRGVPYAGVQAFGGNVGRGKSTHLAPSQVSQWLPRAAVEAQTKLRKIDRLIELISAAATRG